MPILDETYDVCDSCGELYVPGDGGTGSDGCWCNHCLEMQGLTTCSACGRVVYWSALDNEYRCPNCTPEVCDDCPN